MKVSVRKKQGGLLKQKLNEREKEVITQVYAENSKNQVRTAKILGINRNTLRSRLVEYGLLTAADSYVAEVVPKPEVVVASVPKPKLQPAVSFSK